MKKNYVSMKLEILLISQTDVVCTSYQKDIQDVYDGNYVFEEWFY